MEIDEYIESLRVTTIDLIPTTRKIVVIKKLVQIHDIFDLTSIVRETKDELDLAAMQELGSIRLNLQLFHRLDFTPILPFDSYNSKILRFLTVVSAKYPHLDIAKYTTTSE